MYYYITLASINYKEFYPTALVVDTLLEIHGLERENPLQFKSIAGYPWTIIQLIACNTQGNYAIKEGDTYPEINCIEIIRSTEDIDIFHQQLIEKLMSLTGWQSND